MEIVFKGDPEEIEKFMNEIVYPVVYQRQQETEGHYFRFTEDDGHYFARSPKWLYRARRVRGYFPGFYYKEDWYKDRYIPTVGKEDVMRIQEEFPDEEIKNL